jgi:anti-sigma factor RsiW
MVMRLVRRREIACQQAVELVTDYLEGALSSRERARLEKHLRACRHCTEYVRQIRTTIDVTGRVTAKSLTPKARRELVALYREWTMDG